MEETIYQQLGEEGFERLIADFYRRVKTDDVMGPMYPDDDWEGSEKRLRDFLIGRFGGPQRYIEERGHPRLRMRHAPFAIGEKERDRWLELMSAALDEAEIEEAPKAILWEFFTATADFMRNQ